MSAPSRDPFRATLFDLTVPERGEIPVLVEVPHAGIRLPEVIREELNVTENCLLRDADLHVDKLYAGTSLRGATRLVARLSRYVVDLNRHRDDVDVETVPDHPNPSHNRARGVVWRLNTEGDALLKRPLRYAEFVARIEKFHAPYHETLTSQLDRLRGRFGHAIVVAGHSMPSVGRAGHTDPGCRRADVVPGSLGRTSSSPAIIDLVDSHFRAAGLSVRHDDPYRGGWTTMHYGRPTDGWHAIQIELNRALYMDEVSGDLKNDDFQRLKTLLEELVTKLGKLKF